MVFGLFGVLIGLAVGIAVGITAGSYLFYKYFEDLDVRRFDISADYDEKIPLPQSDGKPVPRKYRAFLKYFPNWATMPDYNRVTWMNHIMRTMWPHYNQAIGKMVLDTVKPQVDDLCKQYPFLEALDIELIDFGTKPTQVAGVKVYDSTDDEVIMEMPLTWGSNARVRASARIRLAKWSFYIPIEIANIQMKATSRITLRPLVDTLPCMGAVTITLLDVPYFDFALHLFSAFDLMVLPGIHEAAVFAIQSVVGDLLQYPNKMSFDIMDGGGVPPPPIGMLQVKVKSVKNITAGGDLLSKVDPYVELGVREGRYQRTKTVMNDKNPEFEEVFNVIVDDIHSQTLTVNLHDDDTGFNDPLIGIVERDLADEDFIKQPRKVVPLELNFLHPPAHKKMKRLVKKEEEQQAKQGPKKLEAVGDVNGHKQYKIPEPPSLRNPEKEEKAKVATMLVDVMYVPFNAAGHQGVSDNATETQVDGAQTSGGASGQQIKHSAMLNNISEKDKGILTVTLGGCTNLQSSDKDVDPIVVLTIIDPAKAKPESQKSSHMHNEPNPHWNTKFDFAMISATSVLDIKVYDKNTLMGSVLHNPLKIVSAVTGHHDHSEMIGSLRIKIKDVVRNERIRDSWALQETQKGDIHLSLDWLPVDLENMEGLAEPGDQREVKKMREEQEQKRQEQEADSHPDNDKHGHKHHLPFRRHGKDSSKGKQ